MNYRAVIKNVGVVLCIESLCMLPSLAVSLLYRQTDTFAFVLSILLLVLAGGVMSRTKTRASELYAKDGFAIVAFGWLLVSAFGALPAVFSGAIPSFVDSLFESASGFTTTGASILTQVENLPKGILFWRSFTHWVGGMGVLVLMLALFPSVNASTLHIMKAESPGPESGKIVPKMKQTAQLLYLIYTVFTLAEVILLCLGGMSLYDSLIHAFGTAGTGGFSDRNLSVGAYGSLYIEMVVTVFMALFGVNFALYHAAFFKGGIKGALRNEELRLYFGAIAVATVLVTLNIYGKAFDSLGQSLRYAVFQVVSIITTTGFVTADFNLWPTLSQAILLLLMFIGASAGSTGGGIKCMRVLLLLKLMRREISKAIHPRSAYTVKFNGRAVEKETLGGILVFFFAYIVIFALSVLIVAMDGRDLVSTSTAVMATLNNIGPGLGSVGAVGNYADFSVVSKLTLTLCMIIGRLEVYPILLLLAPAFWKRM